MEKEEHFTFSSITRDFIKENPKLFFLYIITILALPIKDALFPHLLGKLYGCIKSKSQKCLTPILASLVAILIILQVTYLISDLVDNHMFPALQSYTRQLILYHELTREHVQGDAETGMLLTYMMKLPTMIFSVIDLIKNGLIPSVLALIITTAYILYIQPLCGLVLLVIVAIILLTTITSFNTCIKLYRKRDEIHTKIYSQVDDSLNNLSTIQASGTEQAEVERLHANQKEYAEFSINSMLCSQRIKYVAFPLAISFILFACWYGYKIHLEESKFVSLVVVCFIILSTVNNLSNSIKRLISKWGTMQNSLQGLNNVAQEEQEDPINTNISYESTPGHLELVDISFTFPNKKQIFNHQTIKFRLGHTSFVKGNIGAGKSTLISLILKTKQPSTGIIMIDGKPYTKQYVHDHMFYVPQNPKLMNRSIYENIIYSAKNNKPTKADISQLIASLDLQDSIPQDLDTSAGVGGSRLSGGQRQVITLLRLVVADPDIVLLDEPTASLDPQSKAKVINLIKKITQDRTTIWVTHEDEEVGDGDVINI